MEKQKIAVFTTAYHPLVGGAEIAIREITRRLKDRFDFYIITSRFRRDLPKSEVRPEGTVIRLGFGTPFDKWLLPILAPLFHRGSASIVLGVDIGQGSLAAAVLKCINPRVRFILNIQYGGSEKDLSRGYSGLHGLLFKFMLGRADYVTAISKYLLDEARKYGYRGPAEVIPNGVDLLKFQNTNYKLQTKHKTQNTKVIITTSRLVPKNGVDILIKSIADVKKTIPDIQCWIIGGGPERKNLELLTTDYQLQTNIKFFGEVPHEKIHEYLHKADIFVRPSRSEGMGISFVEALAAGLPIIGTNVGGIKDIIQDGKTGIFVKVDDPQDLAKKIVGLLRDEKLSNSIAMGGRKMAEERFSWEGIASSYGHLFSAFTPLPKVLVTTGLFPPEVGGPATYSKILFEELPKSGLKVEVVPFSRVRHFPKIIRHLFYFFVVLRAGKNADIIFAQDPVSVGVPSALAAMVLRKRFLLKIVGDYAWEQGVQRFGVGELLDAFLEKKYGPMVEFMRKVQKFTALRADLIIVPSGYLKKVIVRWGVVTKNIEVVYNSFDSPGEMISKKEACHDLNLSGKIILSAGRLVPWKGFAALIEIMPQVLQNLPDAKLIIIGSGPDEQKLKRRIEELHLGDSAKIVGQVPRRTLLKYLRAADVFLLNTGYEGFSHILLEAMAAGTPIITTDVCGNEELIENGMSGLLAEYDNKEELKHALIRILTDHELARRISEGAKKELKNFSKEKMIQETVKILRTSCGF